MNTKTRNATLLGVAAGLVLIPIIRAVVKKYRIAHREEENVSTAPPNNLFSSYLGKHKPHHRKANHNGVH
jgi:hypothetical protein